MFTTLALYIGYLQVSIVDACRAIITFSCGYPNYTLQGMPLCLMNAVTTLQTIIRGV